MRCPFCGAQDTKVIDSRLSGEGDQVRRRRECTVCKERFTTYEAAELNLPRLVKRDGSRVPFDGRKLRTGIDRAVEKRPVSIEDIDAAINRITRKDFTDVSCGFRAYSREAALRLNLYGQFTYTQESFIDLAAKGVRMTEVPLRVRGEREFGTSRVAGNLWRYACHSASILLRAARDSRPLTVFGSIGLGVFLLGVLCGLFVFGWWVATGATRPFQSVLIGSAAFLLLGFLLIVLALIADMLGRMRRTQEQILYMMRAQHYHRGTDPPDRLLPEGAKEVQGNGSSPDDDRLSPGTRESVCGACDQ